MREDAGKARRSRKIGETHGKAGKVPGAMSLGLFAPIGGKDPALLDKLCEESYDKGGFLQNNAHFAAHREDVTMELNRAVAGNIQRIRKSKKLSLERTAALSGVSRSMLGQIERGEANPSVAILGKIAQALKVPAEILLENDGFETLLLARTAAVKAQLSDGGKVNLRPSLPYDETTRLESFFLDIYISGRYTPEPSIPGCLCHATVLTGTVELTAEGENFHLLEREIGRASCRERV